MNDVNSRFTMSVAEPESPVLTTPKWLEALENKRKRSHRLAHDIGAGSPCLICKEKCKGLNLHFWRKICIECKCRKEDHDVQEDEDYAQFEILFGAKKVKRTTIKYKAQNKIFDWVPPNVPEDLAVDYLKAMPESKLPISDTEGAKYRKQQLEKQLPLHDVDPSACHDLTDKEMKEFEKYLDNLRNNVIGQGRILKYGTPQLYKEKILPTGSPISQLASNKQQKFTPEWAGTPGCLKTEKMPEISHALSEKVNAESYPIHSILTKESVDKNEALSEFAKGKSYPPQSVQSSKSCQANFDNSNNKLAEKNQNLNFLANCQTEYSSQIPSKKPESMLPCPKPYSATNINYPMGHTVDSLEIPKKEEGRISPLRTPSSFIQRKSPIFDKQNNNASILHQDDNCNEKLEPLQLDEALQHSFQPSNLAYSQKNALADSMKNNSYQPSNLAYSQNSGLADSAKNNSVPYQKPYGAATDLVSSLNGLNVSSSEVPFAPLHESEIIPGKKVSGIRSISPPQQTEQRLSEKPAEVFPTPPQTCRQCCEMLNADDVVVQTDQGGESALWHARCFVCETCNELLVDLMYFFNKGKVYCGRHFAEIMKIPRCFACDELIFVKEYTIAENESFHFRHFCCFHCDEPLGGKQYIPKDGQPVCLDCFQIKYGKNCNTCLKPIAAGDQRVGWKDLNFHVSPQCFRCTKCLKSLLGGKFVVKNDNVFCGKECVQEYGS